MLFLLCLVFRNTKVVNSSVMISYIPRCLDYAIYKAKNCWCEVYTHFQVGVTKISCTVQVEIPPFRDIWIIAIKLHLEYQRCKTKNHSGSIDTHCLDWAGSVPLLRLTLKAAHTSFMDCCNQSPLSNPKMESQKFLMLSWHLFPEWGNDRVTVIFANKRSHYIHFA